MGRWIFGGKEAKLPFEVEELDLRLYTIEELCYYIYNNLALIGEDFIDEHLLSFLRDELDLKEEAEKIERFYTSPSDQDQTLLMLLTDVGYYTDTELVEFQNRLVSRRRKNGPERMLQKADSLFERNRYMKAIRFYRALVSDIGDGRITLEMRTRIYESIADSFGMLYDYEDAMYYLGKAYDVSKKEAYLKDMYAVSVLSGLELPKKYFENVTDKTLSQWQKDYWVRETGVRNQINEAPIMETFFKDKKERDEEFHAYVEQEKEAYRAALE